MEVRAGITGGGLRIWSCCVWPDGSSAAAAPSTRANTHTDPTRVSSYDVTRSRASRRTATAPALLRPRPRPRPRPGPRPRPRPRPSQRAPRPPRSGAAQVPPPPISNPRACLSPPLASRLNRTSARTQARGARLRGGRRARAPGRVISNARGSAPLPFCAWRRLVHRGTARAAAQTAMRKL